MVFMQRPLLFAVFALLMASVQLSAQRGGGHMSGGGHGFGGGHGGFASHGAFAGHASGGHAFGGMRAGSSFRAGSFGHGSTFHNRISSRGFNRGFNRGRNHSGVGLRIRSRDFRNNCYWYGCGWGYGYPYLGGGIDPYWWWDSGSSYDQDQQDQIGLANEMNAQSLDEQRVRQQNDQDAYARSAPPLPQRDAPTTDPVPATLLVFRDQHKQEVQNYAIVGQTLWNFAPQRTQKIPLSDLDLAATTKANDERGVDFRLPGAHEGQ